MLFLLLLLLTLNDYQPKWSKKCSFSESMKKITLLFSYFSNWGRDIYVKVNDCLINLNNVAETLCVKKYVKKLFPCILFLWTSCVYPGLTKDPLNHFVSIMWKILILQIRRLINDNWKRVLKMLCIFISVYFILYICITNATI